MRKSFAFFAVVSMLSIVGYVVGVFLLCLIVARFPAVGPFVFVDTHGSTAFSFAGAMLQPAAFMACTSVCLALEVLCVGFDESSLRRLLESTSASTGVDRFYVLLRLVGGVNVLAFVFSFGTLFWVVNRIHRVCHVAVLSHLHSFAIQFAIVCLVNTFLAYWAHRLMHTKWMWEIHKVHHAAEEMNLVTTFRNHPVEQLIMSIMNAFPVALLGAPKPVIFLYTAVNMVYGTLAHSEINLKSRLWDWVWITPAAHRIHHSVNQDHYDKNFGILSIWDYLFGTYHTPSPVKLEYGCDAGQVCNRPERVSELFANVFRWTRPARQRIGWTTGGTAARLFSRRVYGRVIPLSEQGDDRNAA